MLRNYLHKKGGIIRRSALTDRDIVKIALEKISQIISFDGSVCMDMFNSLAIEAHRGDILRYLEAYLVQHGSGAYVTVGEAAEGIERICKDAKWVCRYDRRGDINKRHERECKMYEQIVGLDHCTLGRFAEVLNRLGFNYPEFKRSLATTGTDAYVLKVCKVLGGLTKEELSSDFKEQGADPSMLIFVGELIPLWTEITKISHRRTNRFYQRQHPFAVWLSELIELATEGELNISSATWSQHIENYH